MPRGRWGAVFYGVFVLKARNLSDSLQQNAPASHWSHLDPRPTCKLITSKRNGRVLSGLDQPRGWMLWDPLRWERWMGSLHRDSGTFNFTLWPGAPQLLVSLGHTWSIQTLMKNDVPKKVLSKITILWGRIHSHPGPHEARSPQVGHPAYALREFALITDVQFPLLSMILLGVEMLTF